MERNSGEDQLKISLIPSKSCGRAGIAASWLPINNIGIFPYHKIPPNGKQSSFAPLDVSIFHLRQDVILFQPVLRKLVNESNGTFLSIQALMKNTSINHKPELLKLSIQYRSIIRACLENLQDDEMRSIGAERDDLQNYITIFYSVERIWHLCEILFLDAAPGQMVLPGFLDWIRFHFPKYEKNAANLLTEGVGGLESHPDYWECVIGSFLQGRITVVRALLKLHSQADSSAFKTADLCLKAMPIYIVGGAPLNEFNMQWRHWVVDVQLKIDAKTFLACYNLNLMMKLTIGDENAWAEIQQYCETWYELLAARLFFTQQTVKSFELGQYAKDCIAKMSLGNRLKHLDQVLLSALDFDILQVIKEIQNMTENGWFVSHFTDLFYHCGLLKELSVESEKFCPKKLRESFLNDYGTLLMGHKSLWQVGLSYLDHCPETGLETIKLLLIKLQLDTERRTLKIMREALNRNLAEIAQTVCKIKSMDFVKKRRLGSALAWALKSQDSGFISTMTDKFLREYCTAGKLNCTDLLDNLGSCILASDRLMLLGKYCEFHQLYSAGEFRKAADLLISLIESKIVPAYFWSILLTDTIPLLESQELVFSANDTYIILKCLEEKGNCPAMNDKAQLIRLGAARNLARALMNEAQLRS